MATIPLPELDVRTPQQQDPLEHYARLMQLKNMTQNAPVQSQILQQTAQAGALDVQQKQQTLNDQKAMTDAMHQWDGKDYNDLVPLITKNGGSAQAVMGLKSKILEQQQSLSTIAKNNADAATAQMTAAKTRGDLLDGALSTLVDPKQTPDAMLPQAVQQTAQDLVQKGVLDPQHAQQVGQLLQSGDPTAIRSQLDLMRKSNIAQSQIMEEAAKQAGISKDTAQAAEANANAQKTQQQIGFGPSGEFAKAKYQFILQKAASGQPLSPDDINYAKGYEASESKSTSQSDTLGVTSNNTSRPTGLASVLHGQPAAPSAPGAGGAPSGTPLLPRTSLPSNSTMSPANIKMGIVDQIGQYRENPTLISRLLAKHPEIMAAVQQKYPDWDQTTYNAKNKLISDYTSGKDSQSINAMNTAVGHLSALDEAAQALHNGNIQVLNGIANKLGAQVGADPTTTYNMIVHRVGPEIASSYIPGGGGEGERQATAQDFSASMSPQQIHSNVAGSINLFRSKVGALENQYKQTVGRDDFQQRFFTPEARAAFQKYQGQGVDAGKGGSAFTVTAPNNKVYTFKSQADADAFKQKAGIQ